MQIRVITVPVLGGEIANEELNKFMRGRKVIKVEQQFVTFGEMGYWSFCIHYLDIAQDQGKNSTIKKDYKELLSQESFEIYTKLRAIRKKISTDEGVPAYAVFTDEELAGLAELKIISLQSMRNVKGIGEKKVERYGNWFITSLADEKSQ